MKTRSKSLGGIVVILLYVVVLGVIYNKEEISTRIKGVFSESISADFSDQPKSREFRPGSDVKMAGVQVGTVTDISSIGGRNFRVAMRINNGIREKLGSDPSATVRATLVLGGRYYVDLVPGGGPGRFDGAVIPLTRTSLPNEVYDVVNAAGTPAALAGAQSSIKQFDATLGAGGTAALQNLADHAPATLQPADAVLEGLQGVRPGTDWTELVVGLQHTAAALTSHAGQTATLISTVNRSTAALAASSPALARSVATGPETLRVTRAGLIDLQPALDQLTATAHDFRDSARDLGPFFEELDPAIAHTRRVLADARPLLDDTQPLVERLGPVTDRAKDVFDDLHGPVLDKINGPIIHQLLSPFKGTGAYTGDGANGNKLYEELGFLGVRGAQDFGWHDKVGVVARVGPTAGSASLGALVPSNEQRLEQLGLQRPVGPQVDTPGGTKPLSAPGVPLVPNSTGRGTTPVQPPPVVDAPHLGVLGGNR